jgi:hypothetical protein
MMAHRHGGLGSSVRMFTEPQTGATAGSAASRRRELAFQRVCESAG